MANVTAEKLFSFIGELFVENKMLSEERASLIIAIKSMKEKEETANAETKPLEPSSS